MEGLHSVSQAYADVGMRAVIAPMIADRSFYQAIPGLLDAFPADLRAVAEAHANGARRGDAGGDPGRRGVLAASARPHPARHRADHSAALFGRVHVRLPRPRARIRPAAADASGRIQRAARRRHCGVTA